MAKLEKFAETLRSDVTSFEAYWEKQHAKYPESYPLDMETPSWQEHFILWAEEYALNK